MRHGARGLSRTGRHFGLHRLHHGALRPTCCTAPAVRPQLRAARRPTAEPVTPPIPARSASVLEFTFGDPFRLLFAGHPRHEFAYPVNGVGVQPYRRVQLSMCGNADTFAVLFQPGGLSALFSVPADALTNQDFDGRAVLGAWVDNLRHRLGASSSFAERVRHADHDLLECCPAQSVHGHVAAAARVLLARSGTLRISALVQQSGLSARRFERRFGSQIGMSPKLFARVRFEAALKESSRLLG